MGKRGYEKLNTKKAFISSQNFRKTRTVNYFFTFTAFIIFLN